MVLKGGGGWGGGLKASPAASRGPQRRGREPCHGGWQRGRWPMQGATGTFGIRTYSTAKTPRMRRLGFF